MNRRASHRWFWLVAALVVAAVVVMLAASPSRRGSTREGPGATWTSWRATMLPGGRTARDAVSSVIGGTVRQDGGSSVAGAQVCVVRDEPTLIGGTPLCTTADGAGRYRLTGVAMGHYQIVAMAPTFVPTFWRGPGPDRDRWLWLSGGMRRDDLDIVLRHGGARVRGVVVEVDGTPVAGADVDIGEARTRSAADGTFEVWTAPGNRITAFAMREGYTRAEGDTAAPTDRLVLYMLAGAVLAGVVIDGADQRPVAGAQVEAVDPEHPLSARAGHTGDDGRFRIAGLAPGRYDVRAQAAGMWGEAAHSVALGFAQSGDDVTVSLHPVGAVTGRIVVDDGAELPHGCARGSVALLRGAQTQRALADADGVIRFDAVPPGEYRIFVDCDGHPPADETLFEVEAAGANGLEWVVEAGARLVGTVRDVRGEPVSGAVVVAVTPQLTEQAATDADGRYVMRGLAPGAYLVTAEVEGLRGPHDSLTVTVTSGGETNVDIVVEAEVDRGTIAGVVIDERGQPVAGVSVKATATTGSSQRGADGYGRSRDDGTFTLRRLQAGNYQVVAVVRGRTARARDGGMAVEVTAGAVANVRIEVVREAGIIKGIVVDGAGGSLAGAIITAVREPNDGGLRSVVGLARTMAAMPPGFQRAPVVSDAAGRFWIEALSDGAYTIQAQCRGGGEAVAEHVPVGSTSARLVRALAASMAGTVTSAAPVDDLTIHVWRAEGAFHRVESFFHTAGAFTIDGLPAGTYDLDAETAAGHASATVTLADGERRTGLNLALSPWVTVRGRLIAADDGQPVANMRVLVRGEGLPPRAQDDPGRVTGADGRFVAVESPTGSVRINAWAEDGSQRFAPLGAAMTITPAASGVIDVGDLRLERRRAP